MWESYLKRFYYQCFVEPIKVATGFKAIILVAIVIIVAKSLVKDSKEVVVGELD